jgi:hypothetical protein
MNDPGSIYNGMSSDLRTFTERVFDAARNAMRVRFPDFGDDDEDQPLWNEIVIAVRFAAKA